LELRSTNRFYKSNENGLTFEETVLNVYLRQIFSATISEFKPLLRNLKQYISEVKQQPNAESLLGLDELMIWADSKIK
jgi:hypothetical protein